MFYNKIHLFSQFGKVNSHPPSFLWFSCVISYTSDGMVLIHWCGIVRSGLTQPLIIFVLYFILKSTDFRHIMSFMAFIIVELILVQCLHVNKVHHPQSNNKTHIQKNRFKCIYITHTYQRMCIPLKQYILNCDIHHIILLIKSSTKI